MPKQVKLFYNQFRTIQQIMTNPNAPGYKKFNHLGSAWGLNDYWSFENYILKKLGHRPSINHVLARKDQTKGWYPGNLKWMEKVQLSNIMIDNCVFLKYKNKKLSLKDWHRETGISYHTLARRWRAGWPVKKILTKKEKNV